MLVSCIMPTRDRRTFIPGAIACFLKQSYSLKELIVLDNGLDPIGDLIPQNRSDIHYVHVGTDQRRVGWMRNACASYARGEFIAHFDDDDWSDCDRLKRQVKLIAGNQCAVVGYNSMLFIDEEREQAYRYQGGKNFALGTSLLYRRTYWQVTRFKDIVMGEDGEFIKPAQRDDTLLAQDVGKMMVARIHSRNTSQKRGNYGSELMQPVEYSQIKALIR